jgi:ketosteroid isomerase-like protein
MTGMKIVAAYYEAFGTKDPATLRKLLTDDFTFTAPFMVFDNPDAFVNAMRKLPVEANVEGSRYAAEEDRVAHVFTFCMTKPAPARIPMCEFFELKNGKVSAIDLFYDSKRFPSP